MLYFKSFLEGDVVVSTNNLNQLRENTIFQEVSLHGSKLYIGNLNYTASMEEVEELFTKYGSVESIKIIERKGFGFVEMSTQAEAEEAKEKLDGFIFKGRRLRVNEAKPQTTGSRGGHFNRRF